jgi:uncharacterized protein (DUF2147 family)
MRKLVLAAVVTLAGSTMALADPVLGVWKTQVDDGNYAHITMSKCGDAICGVISRTFNAEGEWKSDNIGKQLVWDMQAQGGGSYKNGKIWQPSKDKVYKSKMALSGNSLKVSGCIGPICRKQTWSRVQ